MLSCGLPFFHASWMTRCSTRRPAHREDFPSQLSVGDTLEWGCRAEAVHFHLALHIGMTHLWAVSWAFSSSLSSSSGAPPVAIGSCWGRGAMQLICAFHPAHAWSWICHFRIMMDYCCSHPQGRLDNLEESAWRTALSCHFASSWRNECSSSFLKKELLCSDVETFRCFLFFGCFLFCYFKQCNFKSS